MTRSLNWMDHAACRGADPSLFFPEGDNPKYREAKTICGRCPVQQQCADYAEAFEQGACSSKNGRNGFFGNASPRARAELARQAGSIGLAAARRRKVLELHNLGLTAKEIAARLRCHERTVMRITKPVRDQQQEEAA